MIAARGYRTILAVIFTVGMSPLAVRFLKVRLVTLSIAASSSGVRNSDSVVEVIFCLFHGLSQFPLSASLCGFDLSAAMIKNPVVESVAKFPQMPFPRLAGF